MTDALAMTDALISLSAIFVLCCVVICVIEAGIRVQKALFFRRTRQFAEQQERQWLTEQQQRRQHARAVRNSNN